MSPTIVLRGRRSFMAVGAAGGATIITTVLEILMNRIDRGMNLENAIAYPRASQRNSATSTAEPDFLSLPSTPGLKALGQKFAISDTSPLDPAIIIAPTIGVATGLDVLGHDPYFAAGEPSRRGGSAARVCPAPAKRLRPAAPNQLARSQAPAAICRAIVRAAGAIPPAEIDPPVPRGQGRRLRR